MISVGRRILGRLPNSSVMGTVLSGIYLYFFWLNHSACWRRAKPEMFRWAAKYFDTFMILLCHIYFPLVFQLFLVWFCDYDVFVGLFFILPCIDSYQKVDLRTVSFDVPPQEVVTNLGYVKSIFRLQSVVALKTNKQLSLSSDSDQRQCNCGSRCCCLLQNQWPHYVSHQCGKGWSVNSSACSDNIAKLSGHQKPEWNFSRPWGNQPYHAGMNSDAMKVHVNWLYVIIHVYFVVLYTVKYRLCGLTITTVAFEISLMRAISEQSL